MPTITFIQCNGDRQVVDVPTGDSVMRAAADNLVRGIVGECGGDLSCATCHVFVEREWYGRLPALSENEQDMLEATAEDPTDCSRLACQIVCDDNLDGLIIHVPASQQ